MREKPLVLIVDDEQDIREIIKTKLEAADFEVAQAGSGQQGIDLAKELKPDIILLDNSMPGMEGTEVLCKLKDDDQTRNIKIFIFTGKGDSRPEIVELNRKFARECGAADFIRKEIDLNELVVKLRKTVEEMKQEEEFHQNKDAVNS